MKLTKTVVEGLAYIGKGKTACYQWDDQLPGFGVRVYPSGRRAFVLTYRANGRRRFLTIGTYGRVTVDEARRIAKGYAGDVARGADPQAQKAQAAQAGTVGELCKAFMERHAKPKLKTWREYERHLNRHVIPRWGGIKAHAVTTGDVAALHASLGKRAPYEANRLLAILSKLFNLGAHWGYLPAGAQNPAKGIDRFQEHSRDRWVRHDELPGLAQAINQEANESARAGLWLYLLTGARKSELLNARWDAVDWRRAELRLADTKAGRVHYIPLAPAALALLERLPRAEGNPYILPGRNPGRPLVNISKPWGRVRAAAGVEDVRLHDLRRTVGSWLAQAGNSLHLIGKVLDHSNPSTTAIYARFGEDQARVALERHADRLLGVAGMVEPCAVVPIRKARG